MTNENLNELEQLLADDPFAKDMALGISPEQIMELNRLREMRPYQDERYSNGDIGYVEKFDEDENMYVQINGKSIRLTEAKIKDVRLAYSITIHKMQGSEVSRVILFIPKNGDNGFVSEKMLYTAITRAKDSIEIYYYNY